MGETAFPLFQNMKYHTGTMRPSAVLAERAGSLNKDDSIKSLAYKAYLSLHYDTINSFISHCGGRGIDGDTSNSSDYQPLT